MNDKNKPFDTARPLGNGRDDSSANRGDAGDLMAELAKFVSGGDAQPAATSNEAANDSSDNDIISKALEKSLSNGAASSPVDLSDSDDGPLASLVNKPFEDDLGASTEPEGGAEPDALAPLSVLRDSLGIPADKAPEAPSAPVGDLPKPEKMANPFDTLSDAAPKEPAAPVNSDKDSFSALGQSPFETSSDDNSSLFGGSKVPEPLRDPGFPPMSVQNETSSPAHAAFEDDLDLIGNLIEQNIDSDAGFGGVGGDLDGLSLGPHTQADMSGLSSFSSAADDSSNPFGGFQPMQPVVDDEVAPTDLDTGAVETVSNDPIAEPFSDSLSASEGALQNGLDGHAGDDFPPIVQQEPETTEIAPISSIGESVEPSFDTSTEGAETSSPFGGEGDISHLTQHAQPIDAAAPIADEIVSPVEGLDALGEVPPVETPEVPEFGTPEPLSTDSVASSLGVSSVNADQTPNDIFAQEGQQQSPLDAADEFAPTDDQFGQDSQDDALAAIERLIEQSEQAAPDATTAPISSEPVTGLEDLQEAAAFSPSDFGADPSSTPIEPAFGAEQTGFGGEDAQLPSILRGPQQGQSLQDTFGAPQENTGAVGGVKPHIETDHSQYDVEAYDEPQKSRFVAPIIAGVAIVALGIGAFLYLGGPLGSNDAPVSVAAQNLDVKKPPEEGQQTAALNNPNADSATLTQITQDPDAQLTDNQQEQFVSRDEQLDQTSLAQNDGTSTAPDDGGTGLTSRQVSTVVVRPDGSIVAPPANEVRQVASDSVTSLQSRSDDLSTNGGTGDDTQLALRTSADTNPVENGRSVEQPSELDEIAQTILQDGASQTQDLGNGEIVEQLDPTVIENNGSSTSTAPTSGDNLAVRSIEPIRIGPDGSTQQPAVQPNRTEPALLANPIPVPDARPNVPTQLIARLQAEEAAREAARQAPAPVVQTQPVDITPSQIQSSPVPAGSYVQVSSQRSESAALQSYRSLQRRFPGLLAGEQPTIVRANLGERGVYYRVRVYPGSSGAASQLCGALKSSGGDCFVGSN